MASPDETERSVAKKLRHLGRKLLKGSSVHKLMQLLHVMIFHLLFYMHVFLSLC